MAWFIYDFDPEGNKYQRGPFPTEQIAQSILDQCESPNAEMHFWNTINKGEAKHKFNELLLERRKGLAGSLTKFKSSKFLDKKRSIGPRKSSLDLVVTSKPDIRDKVSQVRNSVKVTIDPSI